MAYSKFILSTVQQLLSAHQRNIDTVNRRADQIIVWLVGFSIGAIVFLISKSDNIIMYNGVNPYFLMLFCSLTIVCGILYRIFSYISELIGNTLLLYLEAGVIGHENPNNIILPKKIDENWKLEEISVFVKEELNLEIPPEKIVSMTTNEKEYIRLLLIDVLKRRAAQQLNDNLNELSKIKTVIKSSMGIPEKKLNNLFKSSNHEGQYKVYSLCYKFSWLFFILTNLVFLSGFLIFVIKLSIIKICG